MKKFLFILMAFLLIGGFVFAAGEQEKEVEGIVLTVAMHAPDIPEETEAFVNLFASEHPHITVDFTSIRNIDEYLQPKAAAGLMPDFVSINSGSFGADLADRGILADLSNTEAAKNTLDSVKPQYTSPGGKLFGIAGGIASSLIYYNKEIFSDLDLTIPENWEDFLEVCETIKNSGQTAIIVTPADGTIANTLWSHGFANNIVANEPDYIKKFAEGTMELNTPEFADVFAKAKILVDKEYAQKGVVSTNYMDGNNMFLRGEAVMHFGGTWLGGMLIEDESKTGVFMAPWNKKGVEKVPVVATETGWAVPEGPHKEAAIMLLDWLNGPGYHYYQNPRGNIPHLKDPMGEVKLSPAMKGYIDDISKYPVSGGLWFEFIPASTMQLIAKLYQEVLTDQKTPEEAAEAFHNACRDAVK